MTQLYAISLWQPWASLIFAPGDNGARIKLHETRSWAPRERGVIRRGSRLVIHAAKTKRGYREVGDYLDSICAYAWGANYEDELPLGAALGVVRLADWYPADRVHALHLDDLHSGNWGPDRFAWRLEDPEAYPNPVPMLGRQGFWRVEDAGAAAAS